MTVEEDILSYLIGGALSLVDTLVYNTLVPLMFLFLHAVNLVYMLVVQILNLLINIANFPLVLYNFLISVVFLYFYWFPETWATPLWAGILMEVVVAVYWLIKRHVPTASGD